jgi:hypothetical protein
LLINFFILHLALIIHNKTIELKHIFYFMFNLIDKLIFFVKKMYYIGIPKSIGLQIIKKNKQITFILTFKKLFTNEQ